MKKNFEFLGLDETATKEEVDKAYNKLKVKYSRDRFLEGDAGNRASKNLDKLESAYQELCEYFREQSVENGSTSLLDVENYIKEGKLDEAQKILDCIDERNSEWHYLQSVLFYKKNWLNESKKQLEIALSLEPNNQKYNDAYAKLRKKVDGNNSHFSNNYNSGYNYNGQGEQKQRFTNRQMGGTDMGSCVDCCTTYCCMELLCSSCGGCR